MKPLVHLPPPSLAIAILGCGNVGSTFAFQLARVGHDVTVVARSGSKRLEQLRFDGAVVDVEGARATVRVEDRLDERVAYDLLIVTMLAHQIPAVVPALQGSRARCVLFMCNTFEPEILQQAVGTGRGAFGMPFVQAKLDEGGRLKASIGAGGQKTLVSQRRWVEVFEAAGLPATLEQNMPLWLRCHAPLCAAFESVSAAAIRRGGGASWREASVLARGIRASFRLIEAMGHPIHPRSKRLIHRCPEAGVATMLWSLSRVRSFRELLATGEAECAALVDAMSRAAERLGSTVESADVAAMKLR